ncbi:hypothetical protein AA313_de0204569 [Arthrobotrys entomopaga]|nr:hypothetical protein AA313_de0204569 [Arthrobotrys entomopaga]
MDSAFLVYPLRLNALIESILLSFLGIAIALFTLILFTITFICIPTTTMTSLGKYTGNIIEEKNSDDEEEGPLTPIEAMKRESQNARRRRNMMSERYWEGRDAQEDMNETKWARELVFKRNAKKKLQQDKELLKKWKAKQAKLASSK